MKKFKVNICCGTYCHVMGGADLQLLNEVLPEEIAQHVDLRFSTCLGLCKVDNGNPPFVEIERKAISEANITKITEELKTLMGGEQDDRK